MKDQLISFETARLAKEKGFNIPILKYYRTDTLISSVGVSKTNSQLEKEFENINLDSGKTFIGVFSAPTQSLLQKWLREKYNIHIGIKPFYDSKSKIITYATDILKIGKLLAANKRLIPMNSYEEALEIGLQESLNMIN